MYKAQENKREKINKLFDSAYNLFTKNGLKDTSIQNIVDDAGVGKGDSRYPGARFLCHFALNPQKNSDRRLRMK